MKKIIISRTQNDDIVDGRLRYFTLILLELEVVGVCHQYRPRPVYTSVQFGQALPTSNSHRDIP